MKEKYEPTKNRSSLPYGDSTLSPSFTSTQGEVAKWKDSKNDSSEKYFEVRVSELQREYNKLRNDFNMNKAINEAAINFKAAIGKPYYLYERLADYRGDSKGQRFLSIVSPSEFGSNYMNNLEFLGCFSIDSHDVWREVEDA